MERSFGRRADQLRPVEITQDVIKHADGSCLIHWGDTQVICTVTKDDRLPAFRKGTGNGWLSAEYAMLPASTHTRKPRENASTGPDGRSTEIKRLIGRALRAAVDFAIMGERMIWVDCDVICADGGTRCASITGAYVALHLAAQRWMQEEVISAWPIRFGVNAVSVGIVDGIPMLDLDYAEDRRADVDMNYVLSHWGEYIELQGTGEGRPFTQEELSHMQGLAQNGADALRVYQQKVYGE